LLPLDEVAAREERPQAGRHIEDDHGTSVFSMVDIYNSSSGKWTTAAKRPGDQFSRRYSFSREWITAWVSFTLFTLLSIITAD
jgi:hypothetical protein